MLQLKPLFKESIPKALIKAKHYRLLQDPWQAESICRDILRVESNNQLAILYLILAITDQFNNEKSGSYHEAKELCKQLTSEYEQLYYNGLIEERLGKSALARTSPRVKFIAYEHYNTAMVLYEIAEKMRPEDNQDAVLRWNACVRIIQEFNLRPAQDEPQVQPFLDV